ncbi:unnamed protein product [Rotaria magnacalcarata]|uniref:Uncharacterized protein n=1 Tax=Rotaria magnacalcarata TaxID=392030 RepID=A0A815WLH8_9BILA|nr:unnamed protein product [Rotaria magnacalcarata]CAF2095695.1 unnamed protein product [Rotaria magnacalcarata]CAF3911392.1 unnamed protein product [Rotaria magnacalcarata]
MNRSNIRTVNGSRHNVNLERCFIKIQNLAAAALDALDEATAEKTDGANESLKDCEKEDYFNVRSLNAIDGQAIVTNSAIIKRPCTTL